LSNSTSEHEVDLLDLEHDLPTTAEDVAVLRRLAERREPGLARELDRMSLPTWLVGDALQRRPTFAGCEPFEL
jgi:hypothetical protein